MDRRTVMAGLLIGAAGSTQAAAQTASPPARRLAEQFVATLNAHDIDAFAALFSDAYVNHQTSAAAPPPAAGATPKQGTVAFFAGRLKGMPDLSVAIEALVASEDKVAASFVYSGTHQGVYLGVPPTGKKLRFTSCDIFRVSDGLIAEHWGMGDIAGALAQMKG
ncbi:ester cyclase [Methylocapsa sp. S129]|uniref:ester cyclase n=1 Tax=Methylocapsa sp. S129 TaxID=1641869 RepID=UPI00131C95A2|nr:ester cyclase [Methylocapsa sp. S129]